MAISESQHAYSTLTKGGGYRVFLFIILFSRPVEAEHEPAKPARIRMLKPSKGRRPPAAPRHVRMGGVRRSENGNNGPSCSPARLGVPPWCSPQGWVREH